MSEFKYPLNARIKQGLNKYRVIGHINYIDGRGYVVSTWAYGTSGSTSLHIPAVEIEDEEEVSLL